MVSLEELRRGVAGRIAVGESLAPYAGLGIGGAAAFLVEPATEEAFVAAVTYFRDRDIPLLLVRHGSNILVAPGGYDGAAISVEGGLGGILPGDRGSCRAGAGTRCAALVEYCIERGLGGAESLAGLDGTVAGALVSDGGALRASLVGVDVLREGRVVRLAPLAGLRTSGPGRDIVLGATFRFVPARKENLLARRREHLVRNIRARPVNIPRSAVMFRDAPGTPAGELIARSRVRALRGGALRFAPAHPNVLVRTGEASASDVLDVMAVVRRAVRRACGVTLEPALMPVGFGMPALREVA